LTFLVLFNVLKFILFPEKDELFLVWPIEKYPNPVSKSQKEVFGGHTLTRERPTFTNPLYFKLN
jgi:hypothetical protein